MTIFLGCGFAAKYREGGGVLSVPLQWMLGLRRLKLDAIWLELLPATGDARADQARIDNFQRQLRAHGLAGRYCLLYQNPASDGHDLSGMQCIGMSKRALLDRLAGPTTLLNLSYSIHPPFLLQFERRIFCDLDPSEIFYWMTKMEMGQSYHHEFCTIGLNVHGRDCRLPKPEEPPTGRLLQWKTFYPLADTKLLRRRPRPRLSKLTTIGQWYWGGAVEVDGAFPDLSKKFAFEPYLDLPKRISEARFELAMNINADDPERARLNKRGWRIVDPHRVARTSGIYRRYMASALAEFTAIKGVDVAWRTGWISDRAAAFLALGRPVVTEATGAEKYLPPKNGFCFVRDADEAEDAVRFVLRDWARLSRQARECATEVFDSAKNLRNILSS
jgi:glycosyl transferase family 1